MGFLLFECGASDIRLIFIQVLRTHNRNLCLRVGIGNRMFDGANSLWWYRLVIAPQSGIRVCLGLLMSGKAALLGWCLCQL